MTSHGRAAARHCKVRLDMGSADGRENRPADDALLDRYFREISRVPLLSREEERELAERYQRDHDLQAAHGLVVANLRFVAKIAHGYRGYGVDMKDLLQQGNLGLMAAVRRFDPSTGHRLTTYAVWWIRSYIHNFVIGAWSLVKVGTTGAQRRLFFRLRAEHDRLEMASGGQDVTQQLVEHFGEPESLIVDMGRRMSERDMSLHDAPDGSRVWLDRTPDAEEQLGKAQVRRAVRRTLRSIRPLLSARERYLVDHRLMAEQPESLADIGRHFGVTRERVRQIEARLKRKILDNPESQGLSDHAA